MQIIIIVVIIIYDDLVMDKVILVVYSSCGKQVAKYEFNEVFPQSMSMSSLAWDDKNSVLKIPVEMQYYNWKSSNYKVKEHITNETTT